MNNPSLTYIVSLPAPESIVGMINWRDRIIIAGSSGKLYELSKDYEDRFILSCLGFSCLGFSGDLSTK